MISIKDLYKSTAERLESELGKRIFLEKQSTDIETVIDVDLDPAAIVKAYSDHVIIDLGGRKEIVDKDEFFRMEIE